MAYFIDPLRFLIALAPLAMYFVILGGINLSRRPTVISGAWDGFCLGMALLGFVMVGPVELFLPSATAFILQGWAWPLLILCYLLFLSLYVLTSRPKIVIYNVSPTQLRPVLAEVFHRLEPDARWAGDAVFLPHLGVQLQVEAAPALRNVQLIATSSAQSYEGWGKLQRELATQLQVTTGPRNLFGLGMILFGVLLAAMCAFWALSDAEMVAHSLQELLRPGQ